MPCWDIHTDDHADLMHKGIYQLATQFFTVQHRQKSKPRLTPATLALIQLKRSALDYGRGQQIMQQPEYKAQLRALEKEIRFAVAADQASFYDDLVHQLQHDGSLHDFRSVFKLLTRLGGRPRHKHGKGRPLPMLRQPDGTAVSTYSDQQRLWLKQFSAVEGGLPISRDSLKQFLPACLGIEEQTLDMQAVPTLEQLHTKTRRLKRGKAPGPDGILPDIVKAGATPLLQHLVTLTTKVALHGREPATWRGGRLIPLHKGTSARSDPSGYRSIFVSNVLTKLYHAVLRDHLARSWKHSIQHIQFGGRPGCSTDTPHLLVHQHFEYAQTHRVPSAALFVDFKAAFYSVIRQGLFTDRLDDTSFIIAMHRLGVTPEALTDLLDWARQDKAIGTVSAHVERLLVDLFQGTYFELDGLPEISITSRGTRPGDPIGDILFNLVMVLIMKDVTDGLADVAGTWTGAGAATDDLLSFDGTSSRAYCELAFVDDLALLIRQPTSDDLMTVATTALRVVTEMAAKRGLMLNMSAGKTELLCTFLGPGSRRFKQRLAAQDFVVPVVVADRTFDLRIVHCYKHLGGWIHADAKPRHALRERTAAARQAWGPLLQPFFRKKVIATATKLTVFRSLVVSRLTYNVHVLTRLRDIDLQEWENCLRPMLYPLARPFLLGLPPFLFTTATLCGVLQCPAPRDELHSKRLRFVKRLLNNCPRELWNLLHANIDNEHSWLSHLRSSLQWLAKFLGPRCPLDPAHSMTDWWTFIALDDRWNSRVKSAQRSCMTFRNEEAKAHIWERSLETQLADDGALAQFDSVVIDTDRWTCETCDAQFSSKKALAVHSIKMHGYRALVQHYATDGLCPACCRNFHHRSRLCAHLRTAEACLHQLQACFPPLPATVLQALAVEDAMYSKEMRTQGWLSTKALFPVQKGIGPSLPPPATVEAQLMLQRWSQRRPPDSAPCFSGLAGRCDVTVEPLPPLFPKPTCSQTPPFVLQSIGYLRGHADRYDMGGLARMHALLHIRSLCFIHFFSGYRRHGDLQYSIEQHHVQGIVHISCVSVDYCIQNEHGDLTSPRNQCWWKDRLASGAICGLGGGPPCETFTAARLLDGGPPPLRSQRYPNGLPWNTRRGWAQTRVGSELLRFILGMALLAARIGACAFIEHPAYPIWAQAHQPASLWSSRALRLLRQLACCQVVTFDQCVFACAARKPTSLLLVRLPSMVEAIHRRGLMGRCPHPKGWHVSLRGRDESGAFRTSIAKIYPVALNNALADAIADFGATFSTHVQWVEPLDSHFSPLLSYDFVAESHVQPDFYG